MHTADARRYTNVAVVWLIAGAVVVVLWAPLIPAPRRGNLDTFTPFAQLVALRPALALAGVAASVLVLVGAVTKRRANENAIAACSFVLLAGLGALWEIAPRATGSNTAPPPGVPVLTILTANTAVNKVSPATIVDLVTTTHADVIALPETNYDTATDYGRALSAAGEGEWVAFHDGIRPSDEDTPRATSMLVRADLRPRYVDTPGSRTVHSIVRVRLTVVRDARGRLLRGYSPIVAAVHPPPPTPRYLVAWRRELEQLRPSCRRGELIAGDFNATLDHSPMRALIKAGCVDAAAHVGRGLEPTWTGGPLSLLRPAIDHVLVGSGWQPVAADVITLVGSDHRGVWARLTSDTSVPTSVRAPKPRDGSTFP